MAEIRVSSTLPYHPKVETLMKRAEVGRLEAVGHLVFLWLWCADNAVDGILPKLNDWEIAATCKYNGDARAFVNALVDSGFLERVPGSLAVHDWKEWLTPAVKRRLARRSTDVQPNDGQMSDQTSDTGESLPLSSVSPGEGEAKAVKPERRKPPHVEFVDRFKAFYEAMVKQPFKYGRHHFVIAQKLIRDHGLEAVVEKAKILAAMCRDRSTWFTKNGWADFSIEKLSNQWNGIIGVAIVTKEDEDAEALRKVRERRARADNLVERGGLGGGR